MKQKLLILLCVVIIGCSPRKTEDSFRLGQTINMIMKEYSSRKYQLEYGKMSDYLDSDGFFVEVQTKRAEVDYFFNKDKYCLVTNITPYSEEDLKWYIKHYTAFYVYLKVNKEHAEISANKWKFMDSIIIELVLPEEDWEKPYFNLHYEFE